MEQPPEEFSRVVTCAHCHEKQTVRTDGKFGIRFMHAQSVRCVKCSAVFNVILPYQIIGGPYSNE
ncbi:MAG TPA: hypothetical protein VMU53_00985 [Candidatus Sulfotelmatobacter sp.]|nr:hypothetical protein [Candidatus Sulfotelmatobacter sp.]